MPRKTINVCGHCGDRKATDACVICDTDLCDKNQHYIGWEALRAGLPGGSAPQMIFNFGPFCPACRSRLKYKLDAQYAIDSREYMERVTAATENVANLIAREMFGEHDEGGAQIIHSEPGMFYQWGQLSDEWSRKTPKKEEE